MVQATTLLDINDGMQVRAYYEGLRAQLKSDRSTWDPHWDQLQAFMSPRSASWDYSDTNLGDRRDFDIINETALMCKRVLAAGMASGMSPQSSKWFALGAADDALDADGGVRQFCNLVEEKVRKIFLKSNVYDSLLNLYEQEGVIGTAAFLVLDDPDTVIRCYEYQLGRYYLITDATRRVSGVLRELYMTVSQIVEQFGLENCSSSVQTLFRSPAGGNKETRLPVVHVIHRSDYFGKSQGKPDWPWRSIYYEMAAGDGRSDTGKIGLLKESGFYENPCMVGRWRVYGENVYGDSPGMDALGSTMSLQAWEERLAQGAEKQFNPSMVASSDVDPRKLTTLPGDVIFINSKDASKAFVPAYQIDFKLEGGLAMLQRIEDRIQKLMYMNVFQAITEADHDKTAAEVAALQQEKLQVLGPVVERNVQEVLAPLVMRTLKIMERAGMLPAIPAAMKNKDGSIKKFKLEFVSILAKAQKMAEIANLTQFISFVTQEEALDQGLADNVDMDEVVRIYGDLADVPPSIIRSKSDVEKFRAAKQHQQQQQMAADNAQKLAAAAQTASATPMGDGSNLLQKVMPQMAGGQPP